jgi:DNA adenine methylase
VSKEVSTLAPWFGSNRTNAAEPGKLFGKLDWCGVPFAGGMSELLYINARGLLVNDLHRDIINLANAVSYGAGRKWIAEQASAMPFHPDVLTSAQKWCKENPLPPDNPAIDASRALWYFVCVWMGRSAQSGTDDEFSGKLSARFTASGGGSNVRYRSAIKALENFGRVLKDAEFSTLDFREFLGKCHDRPKHGIYVDAPWPDDGAGYKHKFTEADQRELANMLRHFEYTRVVVRFGDHPLIHELYPDDLWTWHFVTGRTQGNNDKAEVLLTNWEPAKG